ncbi:MAG: dimethyl sulfoxide reductase anchor subunit [Anaerolineaceae bacterium]|nr:dimethyl sulfoxide reductase anchor subunit [Anaerolineaceae bacterium]
MEAQWPLVFFTLFTALAAGVFGLVCLSEFLGKAPRTRIPGAIIALVSLVIGGIFSALHLGHLERVFNVLNNLSSGITQELILVVLLGAAIVAYLLLLRADNPALRKIVAAVGLALSLVSALFLGNSYYLASRPAWNTWLMPILYLVSAAVLGLFVMYILVTTTRTEDGSLTRLNRAAIITLIVQGAVILAYVIFLAVAPHAAAERSPSRLLSGDLAWVFWGGIVLLGLGIPLLLTVGYRAGRKGITASIVAIVGLVGVLVGGVAFRALMYILGSSIEKFS